jgi:DNA-directed RNA polymerase subunit F
MPVEKAREMKEELKALDLIRLKDVHIVKIIDFMPMDASELNKVIVEVSLDQEEITKVLDVVLKYK